MFKPKYHGFTWCPKKNALSESSSCKLTRLRDPPRLLGACKPGLWAWMDCRTAMMSLKVLFFGTPFTPQMIPRYRRALFFFRSDSLNESQRLVLCCRRRLFVKSSYLGCQKLLLYILNILTQYHHLHSHHSIHTYVGEITFLLQS